MFSTFDQSFDTLEFVHAPGSAVRSSKSARGRASVKIKSFVGATCKSRTGCLSCRSKHKKCDEVYPICGLCQKRNTECQWGDRRKRNDYSVMAGAVKKQPVKKQQTTQVSERQLVSTKKAEVSAGVEEFKNEYLNDFFQFLEKHPGFPAPSGSRQQLLESIQPEDIQRLDLELRPMDESQVVENIVTRNGPMSDSELLELTLEGRKSPMSSMYWKPSFHLLFPDLMQPPPSNSLLHGLDDKAVLYLDHYRSYVARQLSISSEKTNFFLKYSMQLANYDRSILYGVVAWGGMFLLGSNDDTSRWYMQSGLSIVHEKLKTRLSKADYLMLFAFYIIIIGAEVSTGDVSGWYKIFLQFKSLMDSYGGIVKFSYENEDSNEAKWVLSYFLFHDVLTSQGWIEGTLYPMEQYEVIFKHNKILDADGYGPDPLQGCMQELSIVIGQVANERATLLQMASHHDLELYDAFSTDLQLEDDVRYQAQAEAAYHRNEERILRARPSQVQLEQVEDGQLLELHLKVFEIFQISLRIYNVLAFKRLPVADVEVQTLFQHAVQCLRHLVGSKLQSSLCWPLLLIGQACVTEQDREHLRLLYYRLTKEYQVRNVERAWELLERCWVSSRGGKFSDWCEEAVSLGWIACFC